MNKAALKRVGIKTARTGGQVLQILSSLLLVVYFLGVSAPGRATVSWLAKDEIHGEAEVGSIAVDPVGGAYVAMDLSVLDRDAQPVVEVGGVELVADSLLDRTFSHLLVREAKLRVAVDEEGRVNLLELKKHHGGPPSEPQGFRVESFLVDDSSAVIETPFADLELGPLTLKGTASETPPSLPQGEIEAHIARLSLHPRVPEVVETLLGLMGSDAPYEFGPVEGSARFSGGILELHELTFAFPGSRAYLLANVDVLGETGKASLTVTSGGKDAGALLVQLDEKEWAFSLLINVLDIPGGGGETVKVPRVEMNGLSLNAVPEHLTFKLNRLALDELLVDSYAATQLSTSSGFHFEGNHRLETLPGVLAGQDGFWPAVEALAAQWKKGSLTFSLLADKLRLREELLAAPLRFKVAGGPAGEGAITLEASLALHPHGTVTAGVVVDTENREGLRPYAVTIEVDGLNMKPVLAILDLPGMIAGMLQGTLSGRLNFGGLRLGDTVWHVTECSFDLDNPGGGMEFVLPEKTQDWDMAAGIGFSFFTKEITFGAGKLKMLAKQRTVDGR